MAEERTLGLARAHDDPLEEPSKEELQRRMDEARDSISHTVTEIKETVANQVQAVKETLDWREQFRRRPVVWSVGAAGVGFVVGYGVAAAFKGAAASADVLDFYTPESRSYAAQPILGGSAPQTPPTQENGHERSPGFLKKLSHTPAYERIKDEAGSVGDALVQELGKTAKQVLLPALITSIRQFIGGYLPNTSGEKSPSMSKPVTDSRYQPTLEREQS